MVVHGRCCIEELPSDDDASAVAVENAREDAIENRRPREAREAKRAAARRILEAGRERDDFDRRRPRQLTHRVG